MSALIDNRLRRVATPDPEAGGYGPTADIEAANVPAHLLIFKVYLVTLKTLTGPLLNQGLVCGLRS